MPPSKEKARKMLADNQANSKPLTPAQKRLFGMIAAGKKTKLSDHMKR